MVAQSHGEWVQTTGLAGQVVRALVAEDKAIYAGTDDGVFLSVNNGNTWTAANTGLPKDTVVSLSAGGGAVFAGMLHSGIFASVSDGDSWTAVNQGLPHDAVDTNSYPQINQIASDGSRLYASALRKGVFLSQNGGASWNPINTGLTTTNIFALAVSGGNLFAGAGSGGGVFVLSNSGATWQAANNGLTYTQGMVYSVSTLAAGSGRLYAGTVAGGLYRTADNGDNWAESGQGMSAALVTALYVHGPDIFGGTSSNGVFVSTDNAASWTEIDGGLFTNVAVLCLCASDSTLFAGLYGRGVWRRSLPETSPTPTAAMLEKSPAKAAYGISSMPGGLRYALPATSPVSIVYYDLQGRLVASVVNKIQSAGLYSLAAPSLPSGFYVRDFRAGSFAQRDGVRITR